VTRIRIAGLLLPNSSSGPASKPERLRCPWTACETATFGRPQECDRHVLSRHLPLSLFCPAQSCHWRGGRRDEFKAHWKKYHPGHEPEPGLIYDTKLVLGYLFECRVPVERAEKYAFDFIADRALELGKVREWEDLCGRRAKTGRCPCYEYRN
jgi:hypothetical protein